MISSRFDPSTTRQILSWGDLQQERLSPPDTLYATTGRRLYVLGDIDGGFRPRSNPYDVHAFGQPHPEDPLAEKLQGVWAQPVKGLAGYAYAVEVDGETWRLDHAETFTQTLASVRFMYQRSGLTATREDIPALDLPLLLSTLTIQNGRDAAVDLTVHFTAQFDLEDAWFTKLAHQRNTGEQLTVENHRLVVRADAAPDRWAVAAGGLSVVEAALEQGSTGRLTSRARIAPGAAHTVVFGAAIASDGGAPEALATLERGLAGWEALRAEKAAQYETLFAAGPHLHSPDPALNAAFALARANLQILEAHPARLGRCFYAGLEIFPFWFSNDGAYSLPGMMIAGLRETALAHTRIGLRFLGEGRVPHQISPAGHVAFAGNAQETPLWVMSIWDAYCWTGDRAFLRDLFPGAWQGMFEYVLGVIDPDGDGYPAGPGMVEVEGMGAEKLDSAAYTWAALQALAAMADALGEGEKAAQARQRADALAARFDADWWDAGGGTYAMSLEDPGNRQVPVPHWAVITPLEVGLAAPEHAAATFATLRRAYLNQWGLKHTVGDDERVWTLPTAALSRAAYRYGENELGFAMLRHIAETLDHGGIGLFHEIIPEGACIVQLWSAATFLRGLVEDVLGIQVNAAEHTVKLAPHLPVDWEGVELRDLRFGDHRVSLRLERGAVHVEHHEGTSPLSVHSRTVAPGESAQIQLLR